jgi:hypothetical protein
MAKKISSIAEVVPQQHNANKHTARGMQALATSIAERGWIGAITAAANGETFDGSARRETIDQLSMGDAIIVRSDGSRPIVHIREDIPDAADPRAQLLAVEANRIAELNLAWDGAIMQRLAGELNLSNLFTDEELPAAPAPAAGREKKPQAGHGYDFRDIHAGKLAYRVEAAWRAEPGTALDLYSGQGQLAAWYARRFDRVVRVDKLVQDGIDYVSDAEAWIRGPQFAALAEDFSFIDLDDEGSPLPVVKAVFEVLPPRRSFVLCVTDGSGLNLKLHGKFNPALYGLAGKVRQATTADYERLEELVHHAVQRFADLGGYTAQQWSSVRGSQDNVCYQTYLIEPQNIAI